LRCAAFMRFRGPQALKRMERQLASLHYVLDFKCVPNFGEAQDILLTWNVRDFARLGPAIARAREDTAGAVAANAPQLSNSGESESISSIITSG